MCFYYTVPLFKNPLAQSKVIWKKLVLYRFLKIPYFRKLNFSKGSQNSFLKYIYTCLMSEKDKPLYVDKKILHLIHISLSYFSETKCTAQLLTIFTTCVSV